jgi:hypothetical protein
MKQTSGFISTYSADAFGVCSALYELGGMIVMHDASGCNSTYTTHDEPRWYDMDSMVYISALTEIEAIMGDDSKLIEDVVRAAEELHPEFIAIVGTTIPAMTGFDADAASRVIEERTGIPTFGFATTGMKSYVHGASLAFELLAEKLVEVQYKKEELKNRNEKYNVVEHKMQKINILGLTPLDFSVNGSEKSIKEYYRSKGYEIISTWAMGSTLDEIKKSADADLNIVVSETGMGAALKLKEKYGTPYKIGISLAGEEIDVTDEYQESINEHNLIGFFKGKINNVSDKENKAYNEDNPEILIMGERVNSLSLAKYLSNKTGKKCYGYATTDSDEDEIIDTIKSLDNLQVIIADPLFKPILKLIDKSKAQKIKFISLPHEAFSGRLYRNEIPNLVENTNMLLELL